MIFNKKTMTEYLIKKIENLENDNDYLRAELDYKNRILISLKQDNDLLDDRLESLEKKRKRAVKVFKI